MLKNQPDNPLILADLIEYTHEAITKVTEQLPEMIDFWQVWLEDNKGKGALLASKQAELHQEVKLIERVHRTALDFYNELSWFEQDLKTPMMMLRRCRSRAREQLQALREEHIEQ